MRDRHFGRGVFLYGFVYFSTYLPESLHVLLLPGGGTPRALATASTPDEVVAIARRSAPIQACISIDLTMGEDPASPGLAVAFDPLVDLVRPGAAGGGTAGDGVAGRGAPRVLAAPAGGGGRLVCVLSGDPDPALYPAAARPGQDFRAREASRSEAMAVGLYVEDGILLGVGETVRPSGPALC